MASASNHTGATRWAFTAKDEVGHPLDMSLQHASRREFLASMGAAAMASNAGEPRQAARREVIDTHTHFYDPTRPQGVPWPARTDTALYRPVYPDEFKAVARPLGVTGTVVVEASPWLEDNQWLLDLAARDTFLRGVIGNLKPGRTEFARELERFVANPLFLGLRAHGSDGSMDVASEAVRRDLGLLARHDRALDVLINPDQLPAVAALAAAIPTLRIVIDHCANVRVTGAAPPVAWIEGLRACAAHRQVFMKVSGLVEGTGRKDGSAPGASAFYRPTLDAVWEAFGEDRVIYGGNWPVSAPFASYSQVHAIVREYVAAKGTAASDKYFGGNAHAAYKMPRR